VTTAGADKLHDKMTAAKAFIMGRNMFGPVRGAWDRQWNGWNSSR
jgi:dihydrofolate reductase